MFDKRIMIDFRHISAQTGFSTYLIMILKAINSINEEIYLLINDDSFDFNQYLTNSNNIKFVYAKSKPFSLKQNIEIPLLLKKYNISIYHNINYDIPLFMFLCPNCKLISTIHDLIPITHKHLKKRGIIKNIYFEIMHRMCVLLSDKILTVSEYSKNEIIRHLKVNDEKVIAFHCSFRGKDIPQRTNLLFNNPLKLFFIGNNFYHKNILTAIKAVEILKNKDIHTELNIAGKETNYTDELKDYVLKNKLSQYVNFLGKISDQKVDELYKSSDIFIFPSLIEGFGSPLLEAMNYGLPIISSNKTVMPEVVGNAGILTEPTPESFADKIEYLINNPTKAQELVQRGYERIKEFSQEKFNAKILEVYYND